MKISPIFDACIQRVKPEHLRMLIEVFGLETAKRLAGEGLVAVAPVRVHRHSFVVEEECGEAFITPNLKQGEIVDLIAWHPARPSRWASLTGTTGVLNLEMASRPRWRDQGPVHISETVVEWIRAGCDGIAVLDWSDAEVRELGSLGSVIGAPQTLARLKRELISRTRIPRMIVEQDDARRAA